MSYQATQHYKQQELMSASPARLVVMLYDRAISCLNEAIAAIEAGDIERRWNSNKVAIEIISHLAMTLDFEKGGQIAQNLDSLYKFSLAQLVNVDVRNDPKPARAVIRILEPLRESWDQIAKGSPVAEAGGPTAHAGLEPTAIPAGGLAISA